jgi:hypothetical protein
MYTMVIRLADDLRALYARIVYTTHRLKSGFLLLFSNSRSLQILIFIHINVQKL